MTFEVRKIQESDIDGFRSALDSVVSERKYLLTVQTPSPEAVAEYVGDNVKNNYAHYVALVDGKIVGWADIIPHKKDLMMHVGLLGIGVISQHRGSGLGIELLSCAVNHSREIGLKRIELEVFSNNSVAMALYKKFGFELEGTKRKARYINGNYEDVCIMGLCYV